MIELLAPAGNGECGMAAFQAGAHAIYLGLPQFSARSQAVNCSFEDLRKLKTLALEKNKRIYLAVNTVVLTEEVDAFIEQIEEAVDCGIDAVILQDIGMAHLLRKRFPNLHLHASTQLAIHNEAGLLAAKEMGFTRVVLARECSIETIKKLHLAHPEIELEVFIHGALCYSFSGLCLASGLQLGRSSNRGSCAQVCRNWYETPQGKAHALSCNDLALEEQVIQLREAGVHSLKIEGRMKGPDFVFHTVLMYKNILDTGRKPSLEKLDAAALTFQRTKTTGYFLNSSAQNLIRTDYSGHCGLRLGTIEKVSADFIVLRLERALARHDSILWLTPPFTPEATRQAVIELLVSKGGLFVPAVQARAGDTVQIKLQPQQRTVPLPTEKQVVYLTRSSNLKAVSFHFAALAPYKTPLPVTITITSEHQSASNLPDPKASLTLSVAATQRHDAYSFTRNVTLDCAKTKKDMVALLTEVFSVSAHYEFQISKINLINQTPLTSDLIFMRPSELKKIRQDFYAECAEFLKQQKPLHRYHASEAGLQPNISHENTRNEFSPKTADSLLPFLDHSDLAVLTEIAPNIFPIHDFTDTAYAVAALSPLIPYEHEATALQGLLSALNESQQTHWCFGINNIAHLSWLKTLSIALPQKSFAYFIDSYLYSANPFVVQASREFFQGTSVNCVGAIPWIETNSLENSRQEASPFSQKLPLMISMGCYKKHVAMKQSAAACPVNCSHSGAYELRNGNQVYKLVIRNCVNYLFRA